MRRDVLFRVWSLFGALVLAGCAGQPAAPPPAPKSAVNCTASLPPPPACLATARFRDGEERETCERGLYAYFNALDHHVDCRRSKLSRTMAGLRLRSEQVIDCYTLKYLGSDPGGDSRYCGLVAMPSERFTEVPSGMDYNFGVPLCVRHAPSAPRSGYTAAICHDAVRAFTDREARYQIDSYRKSLEEDVHQKAKAATRRFDCLAGRREACL